MRWTFTTKLMKPTTVLEDSTSMTTSWMTVACCSLLRSFQRSDAPRCQTTQRYDRSYAGRFEFGIFSTSQFSPQETETNNFGILVGATLSCRESFGLSTGAWPSFITLGQSTMCGLRRGGMKCSCLFFRFRNFMLDPW